MVDYEKAGREVHLCSSLLEWQLLMFWNFGCMLSLNSNIEDIFKLLIEQYNTVIFKNITKDDSNLLPVTRTTHTSCIQITVFLDLISSIDGNM